MKPPPPSQRRDVKCLASPPFSLYGLPKAAAAFSEAGVEYHTLTDYDTLTEAALAGGYITEQDAAKLKEWKADRKQVLDELMIKAVFSKWENGFFAPFCRF